MKGRTTAFDVEASSVSALCVSGPRWAEGALDIGGGAGDCLKGPTTARRKKGDALQRPPND